MTKRFPVCFIMPPYLMERLLESKDKSERQVALNNLLVTAALNGGRSLRASLTGAIVDTGHGRRTIADCNESVDISSADVKRTEDGPPSSDESVNRAFEGFGTTRDFYRQVFNRDSIDGNGMRLDGYVHYGQQYNNAFWDGAEMVFGDGDGVSFTDFTMSLDVIAHELTHGVTENLAGLRYHKQSGALNESMSDVFGSLVKQWSLDQSVDEADWLIGQEIFTPGVGADALRSMKAPGTAYDSPIFGKDPQPDHMNKFITLPDTSAGDWGGVHYNSGIPNKAFYLFASEVGGKAWEISGHVWYESLRASNQNTEFQEFANTTYRKAGELYGAAVQSAVQSAWRDVGLHISGVALSGRSSSRSPASRGDESLVALIKQVEAMGAQLKLLSKEVAALKAKK